MSRSSWAWWMGVFALALLSVGLRVPFLDLPATADEGGYAYVAWFWAEGDVLYRDLWVDRPQGLVLVYRAATELFGDSISQLRLAGALWNAASVVAVALLAARLLRRGWALAAAAAFAFVSAHPRLEGFTINGELLTTLPSTVSVLLLSVWLSNGRRRRWLLPLAGASCGLSFLCKQSGIDAGLALVLLMGMLALTRSATIGCAAGAVGAFAAGAAVPFGASVAMGLATAGGDYGYAVFGYRLTADTFLAEPLAERWRQFTMSLPQVLLALGPLIVLAIPGLQELWRRGDSGRLVALWLPSLVVGVLGGGQFHSHYYVALAPALAIAAAAGLSRLASARRQRSPLAASTVAVAACCLALSLGTGARLATIDDPQQVAWDVFAEPRYLTDPAVGGWLRAHTHPDDRVLGLYAAADLYWYARRRSPYPYLWFRGIATIPGATSLLRRTLADEGGQPEYVAVVQPLRDIDPDGRLRRILGRHYERVATVNSVPIYRVRSLR